VSRRVHAQSGQSAKWAVVITQLNCAGGLSDKAQQISTETKQKQNLRLRMQYVLLKFEMGKKEGEKTDFFTFSPGGSADETKNVAATTDAV
jgi:hypothetical protein